MRSYNRASRGRGTGHYADSGSQFWGDRYGVFEDPYGHAWSIATHKYDLLSEQMAAKMQAGDGVGELRIGIEWSVNAQ
jgi:hypothetical protein